MSENIINVDQARAWDGDEGDHWAAHADRYDTAMRGHRTELRARARIAADDHVLDIGCGNGVTTRDAARAASSGHAVGIDLSASMLERARGAAAAERLTNVDFVRGDAQVRNFEANSFDVVISRFGVMFFSDPTAAFSNIAKAVKPGGRLALVVWKTLAENEWGSEIGRALAVGRETPTPQPGAPSPFGLADADYTRGVLGAAGFTDITLDPFHAPFYGGANTDDAFEYVRGMGFTRIMLQDLDDTMRARALDELRVTLAAHDTGGEVTFDSACWFISATRPS